MGDMPPVGLCYDHPNPDIWFGGHRQRSGEPDEDTKRALKICQTCPEQDPCLEYALSLPIGQDIGIWGGTTERQRERIRRNRRG